MRRFCISEMDRRAQALAKQWGMGVETIDFCRPENMENPGVVQAKKRQLQPFPFVSVHAPYYEIFPCAIDPMIRDVAMHRMLQCMEACRTIGARRMIVHSGYAPQMYFPQWFVPKSIDFWREFAARLPGDFELMIENVLDGLPEYIAEVCDGVNDPRVKICLDVGHANAYSSLPVRDWIQTLGGRIAHVHLHNNDGSRDEHAALDTGSIDIPSILSLLDVHAPEADICIESMDAAACIRYLSERGYIHDQSL